MSVAVCLPQGFLDLSHVRLAWCVDIYLAILPIQSWAFLYMCCALDGVEQADTDFDNVSPQTPFSDRGPLQWSAVYR